MLTRVAGGTGRAATATASVAVSDVSVLRGSSAAGDESTSGVVGGADGDDVGSGLGSGVAVGSIAGAVASGSGVGSGVAVGGVSNAAALAEAGPPSGIVRTHATTSAAPVRSHRVVFACRYLTVLRRYPGICGSGMRAP